MFAYNIRIAIKSLRRNPWLTTLLIAAIAVGICISTTFTTLRHTFAKDPLPHKSDKLFYIRLDNWDPAHPYDSPHAVPPQMSWPDVHALMESNIPTRQVASYQARMFVTPDKKVGRPYEEQVRLTMSDFFPMFEVPFQYGSGWDKAADAKPEPVVVINHATNEKLFSGSNSIGKFIHIGDRDFRVVGVVAPWRPAVRYYDVVSNYVAEPEAIYIPFAFGLPMKIRTSGNTDGWRNQQITTFEQFYAAADIDWVQYWVELPTAQKQAEFREFMDNYVREQKKRGRFERPLNNQMTNVMETEGDFGVVRPQMTAMAAVSVLFLAVCSLNLVGLLLGKFLARAPEVSVRRALGATRGQIFLQHVVECELIGFVGGLLGVLLSVGSLFIVRKMIPFGVPVQMDTQMIVVAALLSLAAGLVAGVYPSWRICTMPPAMQLKLQ